jgi:hypothetical protein
MLPTGIVASAQARMFPACRKAGHAVVKRILISMGIMFRERAFIPAVAKNIRLRGVVATVCIDLR